MSLQLYNTLTHTIEPFIPQKAGYVSFYSCGPTVYNFAHIGNMRAYIFADTVKRVLLYSGYSVNHTMNYTDVEDKIIIQATHTNTSLRDLTTPYIEAFQEDISSVNIVPATNYTKATDYIEDMVSMIEKLLENNCAYRADDGSIYFDVEKDPAYGKLVTIEKEQLKKNATGRMKSDEYDKDSAQDFALWKAWTESDGAIFWETRIGKGRPGWHIECSAMARATLGETIDIHSGGVDNIFPHHENEIAQSECSSGKTFSNFFIHNEHMQVEGRKMSKSLGNFFTMRDIIKKGFDPLAFRYWLLTSHYRTQINFSFSTLEASQIAFRKLQSIVMDLSIYTNGTILETEKELFIRSLHDDVGTPEALSRIWLMIKNTSYSKADLYATIVDFDRALGLGLSLLTKEIIPENILALMLQRDNARNAKDWESSDRLRTELEQAGYVVRDTENGTQVTKIYQ